ncbi:exodeoxyribonuclease VII small subunit [Chlamydia trachomatis]|uniref:Exodeoxyribonuclease 7 small subunit n=2 Tax=Chlamydia trachomatis TaxID=813 RepID=EX7S_CHLT2|nr:exodeoxyribonuclease VII small subunit [Chlamydia trachomatis]B0B7P7.1 RecName: Full=Exodeoxyribonuclease 7 small subunit; AltName: Full=Exodeoxyribonuclease VII small subunit; Short=Exonuclease VII small subunit [Chlamydia trachomatis 434/Bu]B0BBW2.1 RecName: Full=Exodeoxyribonuclease 7 small subunit; AltName: Full=Exodeoxyribonuclease VII small subunit; Short=Exonuclease VII small subunit [Chlamydia trachomatis L2b/UCH-1/proctitis]ADH17099.1 exodeoxyribonuclease VII small subunit [Chlamydia
MTKKAKNVEKVPFEDAMKRLEEIIDLMNQPTTSLEASLALYEEADQLMRICESRIQEVEARIKQLSDQRSES